MTRIASYQETDVAYSVGDIEAAFACMRSANLGRKFTPQEAQSHLFAHLEGRCECLADRCPACNERKRNGEQIHLITCPLLETTNA